jgi:hypothetical protein
MTTDLSDVCNSTVAALVLYGIRSAAHLAARLSPVLAYGQRLLLYAATLSAPPT